MWDILQTSNIDLLLASSCNYPSPPRTTDWKTTAHANNLCSITLQLSGLVSLDANQKSSVITLTAYFTHMSCGT